MPLAVVAAPVRIHEEVFIDWDGYKIDTRCVAWLFYFSTESDVMYSAVDAIWYPEIARALSPHIPAGLFFESLLDGRAVANK